MSISIKLNKSKTGSFRINPKDTGTEYVLALPGVTITYKTKRTKSKRIGQEGKALHPAALQTHMVESAPLGYFQPEEYQSLRKKINLSLRLDFISTFLICSIALIFLPFLINTIPMLAAYLISGISILGILIKIHLRTLGRIKLEFGDLVDSGEFWRKAALAQKLWQVTGISEAEDKKENGGFPYTYQRKAIKIRFQSPYFLKSNVSIVKLSLSKEILYLLPQILLIIRKRSAGIIKASDIILTTEELRYVETDHIPNDAEIPEYTWKYINNDGSPDKRYKDNIKLPVCNYGLIKLESNSGLKIYLISSKQFVSGTLSTAVSL